MLKNWGVRSVFALVTGVALLIGLSRPADAQRATATILGIVTDPSGGAVPDANVQATNLTTGVEQNSTTNTQGRYLIPDLQVGEYEIRAKKTGFQVLIKRGVTLSVGAEVVVDMPLTVGQISQTVTVESDVPQVETASAALSSLVEPVQIRELPLNGRNFEQLILLAPGVQTIANIGKSVFYGNANAFSVSGSRPSGQQQLLDETEINDYMNRGSGAGVLGSSLGVDALGEFQVLTNTYSAQFGGNGAVMNAVSRSGTNTWHGSAYEFIRNSALDAKQYFDPSRIPPFKRNQFGGTLGGPIQRNKMFFFFNYEGIRQSYGESAAVNVPDDNARVGKLPCTAVTTVMCAPGNTYYDFSTGVNAANFGKVQPFLQAFPSCTPCTSPTGVFTMPFAANQPAGENYYLGRYDWTLSPADSLFVRYLDDQAHLTEPFEDASGGGLGKWPQQEANHNRFATIEEKHVFSNHLVSTLHFGYSRTEESDATLSSVSPFNLRPSAPDVNLQFNQVLTTIGSSSSVPLRIIQSKFAEGGDFLWTKGAHSFKFGGSVTRVQSSVEQVFYLGGRWTFTSLENFLQDIPLQRFFIGVAGSTQSVTLSNGSQIPGDDPQRDFREFDYASYFEDSWRATNALTLNIGLRWAPTSNPYEVHNKLTNIVPAPYGLGSVPCSTPGVGNCSPVGTLLVSGFTPVDTMYAHNPSLRNFDPRVGVAWDPFKDHKTSIRAGYGIFHAILVARDYAEGSLFTPPWALGGAFAQPGAFPSYPNIRAQAVLRFGFNHDIRQTPYMQQWNLSVQREVAKNTVVTLAYVGSRGIHNVSQRDINPPLLTGVPGAISLDPGDTLILHPGEPALAGGTASTPASANGKPIIDPATGQYSFSHVVQHSDGTFELIQNNAVSPAIGFLDAADTVAWSKYNSAQIVVDRRLTNGLQFQASYTYSHCTDIGSGSWNLDNAPTEGDPYNPNYDRGLCGYDIRHNLIVNGVYMLPFRGNKLVAGWQIGGIFNWHTGLPMIVTNGFPNALENGSSADRPNYTPNAPGCNNNPYNNGTLGLPRNYWLNVNCFGLAPAGELGNLPRNALIGPGAVTFDPSVVKNTKINEQVNVEFRAEFFNVLNHANLANPNGLDVFSGSVATALAAGGIADSGASVRNSNFGQITSLYTESRRIQFGLKLSF